MKKFNIENFLAGAFQAAIVTLILVIVALVGVNTWMEEDILRVAKLKQHFYEVALARSPAAPAGVRPNYGELSEPRTRVFQDASREATGMGYDKRKSERGR